MDTEQGINAVFLHATEGILVVNEHGHITQANPSAEKLFAYEPGGLTGNNIGIVVPKRFAAEHKRHHENYIRDPHPRSMGAGRELYGLKKDGSEFPIEISLSPFIENGKNFVIAFIIDITLRKQAEEKLKNYSAELEKQVKNRTLILEEAIEELQQTKKNLHHALDKERELNELKSRFVSMASHEFRTPLTTIMSSLALVTKYGEQNNRESQAKHVEKIKSSVNNLTDILNDLLSVSKLEEGKLQNNPEAINLKEYMTEIITEMNALASAGQQIFLNYQGKETVIVDKKFLKNVLLNLLSNAIKFSPDNGRIDVHVNALESSVKIAVSDSGMGIPKEDQKHLFERFFRGRNVAHIQGTGLGMNIVSKYAELMNASLDFESEENKGSTFTIIIPQ